MLIPKVYLYFKILTWREFIMLCEQNPGYKKWKRNPKYEEYNNGNGI